MQQVDPCHPMLHRPKASAHKDLRCPLTRTARCPWTIGTDFHDQDSTVISFTYWPGLAAGQRDKDGTWLQFIWSIPDNGTPSEIQAAAALRQLAQQDPKSYAQVRGGSRAHAEALGFSWPEPEGSQGST